MVARGLQPSVGREVPSISDPLQCLGHPYSVTPGLRPWPHPGGLQRELGSSLLCRRFKHLNTTLQGRKSFLSLPVYLRFSTLTLQISPPETD
jgi:hypothetical protein